MTDINETIRDLRRKSLEARKNYKTLDAKAMAQYKIHHNLKKEIKEMQQVIITKVFGCDMETALFVQTFFLPNKDKKECCDNATWELHKKRMTYKFDESKIHLLEEVEYVK